MVYRFVLSAGALALTFTAFVSAQAPPAKSAKNWTVARTPDGKPDLQGVWTHATLTPLERPAAMNGKATVSDAEAAAWEKKNSDDEKKYDGKADNPIADS